METVAIVGVGLIGGSFALGLRAAGFQGRILGVSSARTLQAAQKLGVIDQGLSLEDAVPAADLVYLANPIYRILEALPRVAALAKPGALVTDAGSTKEAIVAQAAQVFHSSAVFLGGHPMAGKAERGAEAADPALFQGAKYVLTPHGGVLPDTPLVQEFCAWLDKLGAITVILSPEDHDRIVAFTSHLPQLASTALASLVLETVGPQDRQIAGGGLRDMTRLARSAYDLWRDICLTNATNIDRALSLYIQKLEHLRQNLRERQLETEFEQGAVLANDLHTSRPRHAPALEPR
jgi:prephenate dehydrogenase